MATLAILPVKTFGDSKQRLETALSSIVRRALAEAMFTDVLNALRRAGSLIEILVVTTDERAQRIAGSHGAQVLDAHETGHSAAAAEGIAYALARSYDRVLLIPGDCPTLRAHDLEALLAAPHQQHSAVIVADRHGDGTNALLLTPPDCLTPSFGPGSCERHVAAAESAGIAVSVVSVPSLEFDVDTPEDLDELHRLLDASHGGAAHTRGMLKQMLRTRA